jgi:predicted RNA methylase
MSYLAVQGQQTMTLDYRRNKAYYEALKQVITPESVVLDLGAGLGILGLLAAQLGAKQVYLVEPEDIIQVTREIVAKNNYSDRVTCLQGKIEEIDLPEAVDIIISVFTGNFLLQEDLLPSLFYARNKYLKPNGVMIPNAAIMEAVPVSIPEFYQQNIACWSELHLGIDHSEARKYVSQGIYFDRLQFSQAKYLAKPTKLLAMDFYHSKTNHCDVQLTYKIEESGLCHGWVGWFAMQLGDKWLSTGPHEPPLHWSAAFLPLDPPLELAVGEEINFKLQRPAFGDWSWKVKTNTTSQQHSTFLASPMTLKKIKKFSPQYQPSLNDKGKAAQYVLTNIDGKLSVEQLSTKLTKEYPQLFKQQKQALNFVRNLIANFS